MIIPKKFIWEIHLSSGLSIKVHILWEGHKILQNINLLFDWQYIGQIICGDFAKFCGLFRIYELYKFPFFRNWDVEELGELKEMTGKLRSSQFLRVWFPKCDIIQEIDEKLLYHEKTKKRALLAILFQIRLQKIICPIMQHWWQYQCLGHFSWDTLNHFRFFFLHHGTR